MITISTYQITPFLSEGYSLPGPDINNGTDWLREAINIIYNRSKERIKVTGVLTNLFHNHDEQSGLTIPRYPLIQYQKKGGHYFVTGIDEGCTALETLFDDLHSGVTITDKLQIAVKRIYHATHEVNMISSTRTYSLTNWLPFNRENYTRYKQMATISEKIVFLEQILRTHLVKDFGHYLNLNLDNNSIMISITAIDSFTNSCVQLKVNKHIHDFQPFSITFSANITLPPNICLGNGKVFGFGLAEEIGCTTIFPFCI
jgi:hypothetical protein